MPDGDLLLHAGDLSPMGLLPELTQFFQWFAALPHPHKVCIAGNHDFLAERDPYTFAALVPDNVIYLRDESVEIAGIRIHGSPITPWFHDWAFNRRRGQDIRPYWHQIPQDTDILITHGPPYGIRDLTIHGELVGCEELNARIWEVRPRMHVFGHIHEAYGITVIQDITFANAAVLDAAYQQAHAPLVFDW